MLLAATQITILTTLLQPIYGAIGAVSSTSHPSGLRTCEREKSENLGIVGNLTVCTKCEEGWRGKNPKACPTRKCLETASMIDEYEGIFINKDFTRCNMKESDKCFKRGIRGEIRFRLRKTCVLRNKAKKYDFTVHIKIPMARQLEVTTETKLKVHGLPENSTRGWLSPTGDELIFNINDVSWKDLQVFIKADEAERKIPSRDVIVKRTFDLAPLSASQQGFKSRYFDELNIARNGSAEIIDDDETAFFICKQDHVHENVVTERFWQQKVFSGIVHQGHAHSVTYKMLAALILFILAIIMLCLFSALLTLKKQSQMRKAREARKNNDSTEELVSTASVQEYRSNVEIQKAQS